MTPDEKVDGVEETPVVDGEEEVKPVAPEGKLGSFLLPNLG